MPRNTSGVYSLPASTFSPGGLIKSADMNSNFADIATALTGSLPVNGAAGMTGQLSAADGTQAAPGIAFNSDKGTGFYRTGAGQFAWVSGGTVAGTFAPGGLTVNGTLDVVGTTTLGAVDISGTLAVTNLSATSAVLTGATIGTAGITTLALTNPLGVTGGGTPVFAGNAASTGSANAQVVAASTPNNFTLTANNIAAWLPGYTNAAAMTLAFNGTAATNVFKQTPAGPAACRGGEVVVNQMAVAIYDGTEFQLINAAKAAGFGALTNLASDAGGTTDIGTVPSQFVSVTGTNAIASFGSSASTAQPVFLVMFAASLLLTYNAVSLITPTATNIATQAGDVALCQYLGGGNWRVLLYKRANPGRVEARSYGTAGAITYTPTPGCWKVYMEMVAGGGGSGNTATSSGGATTFGSWTTVGGGNPGGTSGGTGGSGGVDGTGVYVKRIGGANGIKNPGTSTFSAMAVGGGTGLSPTGGWTTSGPGCGGNANSTNNSGGGGGEFVAFWVIGPSTTSGVVGAGGPANGNTGDDGAIYIQEFFQ